MPLNFEPVLCRRGFVNLAPKYLYQRIIVNFFLSIILRTFTLPFKTGTAAGFWYVTNLVICDKRPKKPLSKYWSKSRNTAHRTFYFV